MHCKYTLKISHTLYCLLFCEDLSKQIIRQVERTGLQSKTDETISSWMTEVFGGLAKQICLGHSLNALTAQSDLSTCISFDNCSVFSGLPKEAFYPLGDNDIKTFDN